MTEIPRLRSLMTGDEKHSSAATSTLDVLRVLYERVLDVSPETIGDERRDRFYLSKGHGPMAYYAVLADRGFFPESWLAGWGTFDSPLGFHPDRLSAFFDLLPRRTSEAGALATERHEPDRLKGHVDTSVPVDRPLRHVLEVRHASFRTAEFCDLLRAHDIGMVVADSAGTWPMFDEVTSDLAYVRLHGDEELYTSGYGDQALDHWARKVLAWDQEGLDVFVYFDNDAKVHAPFDALGLLERVSPGAAPPR